MHRPNPACWVWSPRPPPYCLPQQSGSLTSDRMSRQEEQEEEEEEESGEPPAVCCYTGDVICQAADAQWSICQPPIHPGTPCSTGLAGRCPGAPPSEKPMTVIGCEQGDISLHVIGGHHCGGPGVETQGCVCVYGQREQEGLGPCWPGAPYVVYGLRTNLVVGVEVVEEVAVEDTVEVITEDIYTDDLLHPELLQDDHLYPT